MSALTHIGHVIAAGLKWAPQWMIGVGVLVGCALIALLLYTWALRLFVRMAHRFGAFPQTLVDHARGPVAAILIVAVLGAALPAAGLSYAATADLAHVLLIVFVLAVGWASINALELGAKIYLRRFQTGVADNLLARKHVTQVNILKRAAETMLILITIGAALMTIESVRQYGLSLFASAGAAGLVLGLSARPLLSNLIAGIQIALTQPIRLEDAVVVEGEWGWIEDITSTYVVIRIWDLRRLIVPLTYFIEKPFQNWTHRSADLLGSVHLNVDWTVPVDRLRDKLNEIVHASERWDGKVVVLQVVEATGPTVQLRVLVSAKNSGIAWDLRCEVREKLVAFLQAEYPHALPRQRAEIAGSIDELWKRAAETAHGEPRPVRSRAPADADSSD